MRTLALLCLVALAGCTAAPPDQNVSTLYRSSFDGIEVIHVATFDSRHGEAYNAENCTIVRDLMKSQPGVTTAYWCVKGRAESSIFD